MFFLNGYRLDRTVNLSYGTEGVTLSVPDLSPNPTWPSWTSVVVSHVETSHILISGRRVPMSPPEVTW